MWFSKLLATPTSQEANCPMTGILALPPESAKQRCGEIYITYLQSLRDAAQLLNSIWTAHSNTHLVCTSDQHLLLHSLPEQLQSNLHNTLSTHAHRSFFWRIEGKKGSCNFHALLNECKRLRLPTGSQVSIVIGEQTFGSNLGAKLRTILKQWQLWAAKYKLGVNLLIHGDHQHLRPALMGNNDLIAGMSSLQRLSDQYFHYNIHYWRTSHTVIADHEYPIRLDEHGNLTVDNQRARPSSNHDSKDQTNTDEDAIYICQEALFDAGESEQLRREFSYIAPDNNALLNNLVQPRAASIILACSSAEEVMALASNIYSLRQQYGGSIKILVRECRDCLRYSDEQLLINAGANLIVPHSLVFSLFMSQLNAIQGHFFKRPLPPSLDSLLESWPERGLQGYFEPADFIRHGQRITHGSQNNDIDDILLRLRPARGIPTEHCLSLCTIRRDGDLVTVAENEVFMLFQACRLNDINAALRSCYALPTEEMFASQDIYHDSNDIQQLFYELSKAKQYISAETGQQLLRDTPLQKIRENSKKGKLPDVHLAQSSPIKLTS